MSDVFIAFQHNEESRPVIDAIVADNPNAVLTHPTGLVKINAPGSLTIRRGDFSIGEGPWAAFDIVANDIQIKFRIAASGK